MLALQSVLTEDPLSSFVIWWVPSRIALYGRGGWQTLHYPKYSGKNILKQVPKPTLAVSPIGVDGLAHFVAWDVDSGRMEDMKAILATLPQGCRPLVSFSGKKGWHAWLFFDRPVATTKAKAFAKEVARAAGVGCEIFPTGKNSRCLKWPGSFHPETKRQEVFIDPKDQHEFDTKAVLEFLVDGNYRSPAEIIEGIAIGMKAPLGNPSNIRQTPADCPIYPVGMGGENVCQSKGKIVASLDELARSPEVAKGLMELAGRKWEGLGKAFKCILPGHQEQHPSGSFFRAQSGHILYGDLHQRDGEAVYVLSEVYYGLAVGRMVKLRAVDQARWLAGLGLRLGYATPLVEAQRAKLAAATEVLTLVADAEAQAPSPALCGVVGEGSGLTRVSYSTGCSPAGDWTVVLKVWEVVAEEALIQAFGGFEEISLSARFLARRARVKVELANRAVNLLCCLGLLEKTPGSGGVGGDRFKLCEVNAEEVERRFELLFPDGNNLNLRGFCKVLVAERLGGELAAAVFRRGQAEDIAPKETLQERFSSGNVGEGATMRADARERATKHALDLVAEIGKAESIGDWQTVRKLLALSTEVARKRKSEREAVV